MKYQIFDSMNKHVTANPGQPIIIKHLMGDNRMFCIQYTGDIFIASILEDDKVVKSSRPNTTLSNLERWVVRNDIQLQLNKPVKQMWGYIDGIRQINVSQLAHKEQKTLVTMKNRLKKKYPSITFKYEE